MPDEVDSYLDAVDASYGDSGGSGGSSGGGGSTSSGDSLDSILGNVTKLAGAAGSIYGQINGQPKRTLPTGPASSGFSKYLPWVIGGAVLLVVLAMFTGGRR